VASVVVSLLALGGAAGSLVAVERAVVTISVQPTAVRVDDVPLTNGPARHALATTHLEATATETQTIPIPTRQVPATAAAGYVYFWCSPMTSCPNGFTVHAGTRLTSRGGASYLTETSTAFPSCQPSGMVAILAVAPGAAGNAGAGAVTYGQLPSYIHVTNSAPITGGSDARVVPIMQQSTIDSAQQALAAKVASDLSAELRAKAGPLTYLPAGSPALTFAADARPGSAAPTVTVTVSGTQSAVAFSDAESLNLLRSALARRAPDGYVIAAAVVTATYRLDAATGGVTGAATAYAVPEVDTASLAAALRGQGLSQATATLRRAVPGGTVTIRTAPFASPWLPVLADHISVILADEPA
jgi:hypothetical protein